MILAGRTALALLGLCWAWAFVSCEEDRNVTETNGGLNEPDFEIPEYVIPCNRKDPNIDSCLQNAFNRLKPYVTKGIPELDLPPLEPLVIPEMKIENGQGPVRVRAVFTNITAIGPGNYSINKIRSNIASYRFDLHLSCPKIELQGNYDVNGNILLFPIQSHGNFWALIGDIAAIVRVQGVEQVKDGVRYLNISRLVIDFNLGRVRFRVTDQLNGDNVIGQAMNQFLNQNAKEIIEEMKPAASASIAKFFKQFLNTGFSKIPIKVWLPDG